MKDILSKLLDKQDLTMEEMKAATAFCLRRIYYRYGNCGIIDSIAYER